jgi:mannose-6-phosphate isomerase-like protein (cupin superfamily)
MQPDRPQLISDLPRMSEVVGHFRPVPFYVEKDMFGGVPVEIAGGEISELVDRPVAEPHVHDVAEIYLLLSPSPGGAQIDIEVDGERFTVESPAAFYVPAGATHRFVTRRAERGSYCLGVLLTKPSGEEARR